MEHVGAPGRFGLTMRSFAPILITVALAGCGGPTPTNISAGEHGYVAKVRALPPGQQQGVLFRAIQSGGGQSCQSIAQVESFPPRNGEPVWRVTCGGGVQWSVQLQDDGVAVVTGANNPG